MKLKYLLGSVLSLLILDFLYPLENDRITLNEKQLTEEQAITEVVKKAYQSLSFTEGRSPDFETLDQVFLDNAIFRGFRGNSMNVFYKEPYFRGYKNTVQSGSFKAIVEKEIWGKTQFFGQVAHRFSSYELYYNDLTKPVERGVNSFQLVKIEGEWKISSTVYDVEKTGQSIPEKYLK